MLPCPGAARQLRPLWECCAAILHPDTVVHVHESILRVAEPRALCEGCVVANIELRKLCLPVQDGHVDLGLAVFGPLSPKGQCLSKRIRVAQT